MPKKLLKLFLGFFITVVFFSNFTTPVQAGSGQCNYKEVPHQIVATATWPDTVFHDASVEIKVSFTNRAFAGRYSVILSIHTLIPGVDANYQSNPEDLNQIRLVDGEEATFSIDLKSDALRSILSSDNNFYVKLQKEDHDICDPSSFGNIKIENKINISNDILKQAQCAISTETSSVQNANNILIGENFTLKQSASHPSLPDLKFIPLIYRLADFQKLPPNVFNAKDFSSQLNYSLTPITAKQVADIQDITYSTGTGIFNAPDSYVAAIAVIDTPYYFAPNSKVYICKAWGFSVSNSPTSTGTGGGGAMRAPLPAGTVTTPTSPTAPVGASISGGGQKCTSGFTDEKGNSVPAVATAIGCIPTEPVAFIKAFLRFVLGIGGGVAFLIMVMGVFQMITSAGNPDSLKNGSDMLTNAIIGILFIIFSLLFFQIIGFGILKLPGFSI